MPRKKISDGMHVKSVSISKRQFEWLNENLAFNFSEFVRECLDDMLVKRMELENL